MAGHQDSGEWEGLRVGERRGRLEGMGWEAGEWAESRPGQEWGGQDCGFQSLRAGHTAEGCFFVFCFSHIKVSL